MAFNSLRWSNAAPYSVPQILVTLEKFKALLLEHDLNENGGACAADIHRVFGDLYRLLDQSAYSGLFPEGSRGDDAILQCLSTYVYVGEDSDAPDEGVMRAYDRFRGALESAPTSQVGGLLKTWLAAIQEMIPQIRELNSYLLGQIPQATSPSLICQGRTVGDDYNVVIRSLELSFRYLAMLFKFWQAPGIAWHERVSIPCPHDPQWTQPLLDHLNRIVGTVSNTTAQTSISALADNAKKLIPTCFVGGHAAGCQRETSMLEVVERMELYMWRRGFRPKGSFRDQWNTVFASQRYNAPDAVRSWYTWTWYQQDFPRFVQHDSHDEIFRYILSEYEAEINNGTNLHFSPNLQLEHIFPQNPNPLPPQLYAFRDADEYRRFLNRSGNLTYAPTPANQKWTNELPETKASHYATIASPPLPQITSRVGAQLLPLGADLPAYRHALEIRCAELAIFCLKRFNAR